MTYDVADLTRLVRTKILVCECGCWYWLGSCDTSGYAKFKLRQRTIQVHRYAYERLIADIPDEMTLDHLNCTSRKCVRPDHMQVITRGENSERANATRWHDQKFLADGTAIDRVKCEACYARDNAQSLAQAGEGKQPRAFSDAVAQPL